MTENIYSLLITAFVLGFSSGISPGVLFALIISESIQHGAKAGIRIAMAPLITDLPIILISLYVFSQLSQVKILLFLISLIGGSYICYLGYKNITVIPEYSGAQVKSNSLRKGVIANIFAPGPYVFWMSIGAPLLSESFSISFISGILFIVVFYVMLVGMQITIGVVSSRMKKFIGGKFYLVVVRTLGLVLIALGLFYVYNGYAKL